LNESFKRLQMQAHTFQAYIPWVCGALIIGVLFWNYVQRKRYLKELALSLRSGISVDELKPLLDRDDNLILLDVRDELDAKANPETLPKARWIPHDDMEERMGELQLEKPIVVFCDCPAEQTSGSVAELLRQNGAKEVRPLIGGLHGWKDKGFGTVEMTFEPSEKAVQGK
jgi:rhodanese-related sulfurtransferase